MEWHIAQQELEDAPTHEVDDYYEVRTSLGEEDEGSDSSSSVAGAGRPSMEMDTRGTRYP